MWIKMGEKLINLDKYKAIVRRQMVKDESTWKHRIVGILDNGEEEVLLSTERSDVIEAEWARIQEMIFKQQLQIVPMPIPVAGTPPTMGKEGIPDLDAILKKK